MRHTILTKTITTIAAFGMQQLLCAAEWQTSTTIDPITDQVTYHVWMFGTELSDKNGEYCPKLAIRITPTRYDESKRRMLFTPDVFIWCPAIKRKTEAANVNMTLRFNDESPETSTWIGSNNKCALFCEDPTNTLKRIVNSQKLALRFTHKKREHTTMFKLDGLSAELANIKTEYLKRIGKHNDYQTKKSKSANIGHTAPIGSNKTLKNNVINQVDASIMGEYDAQINDYYRDMKDWLKSQRLTTHPKAYNPKQHKLTPTAKIDINGESSRVRFCVRYISCHTPSRHIIHNEIKGVQACAVWGCASDPRQSDHYKTEQTKEKCGESGFWVCARFVPVGKWAQRNCRQTRDC